MANRFQWDTIPLEHNQKHPLHWFTYPPFPESVSAFFGATDRLVLLRFEKTPHSSALLSQFVSLSPSPPAPSLVRRHRRLRGQRYRTGLQDVCDGQAKEWRQECQFTVTEEKMSELSLSKLLSASAKHQEHDVQWWKREKVLCNLHRWLGHLDTLSRILSGPSAPSRGARARAR